MSAGPQPLLSKATPFVYLELIIRKVPPPRRGLTKPCWPWIVAWPVWAFFLSALAVFRYLSHLE
jgi:hypothetical protein